MIRTILVLGCLAAGGAVSAAPVITETYSSFWTLGDSLTDNGTPFAATGGALPPSPLYFNGRVSNGPVWAEAIAADFAAAGLATANLSFAGATAVANGDALPDLPVQQALFSAASAGRLGDRPLVTLWFGANDVIDAVAAGLDAAAVANAGAAAADAVVAAALGLVAQDVRDIVVFNLPDLSLTPRFALFLPGDAASAGGGSDAFNAALANGLGAVTAAGARVTVVDIDALFGDLLADPERFNVRNVTLPCVFPSLEAAQAYGQQLVCSTDKDAPSRAFYDTIHPNSVVHAAIGDVARAAIAAAPPPITPVPLPAGGALLALGLLGLATLRHRPRR